MAKALREEQQGSDTGTGQGGPGIIIPDRCVVVESVLFHDRELEKQDSCINERWLEGWQYLDTTLISGCAVVIRFIQK